MISAWGLLRRGRGEEREPFPPVHSGQALYLHLPSLGMGEPQPVLCAPPWTPAVWPPAAHKELDQWLTGGSGWGLPCWGYQALHCPLSCQHKDANPTSADYMPTEDCAWPFTQWCPLLLMTSVTTRCCVPHFIAKKADAQRSQAACPKLPRTSLQLVALGIELRSFWPLGTAFLFENSPVPSGWAVSQILLQPYAWVYNPGWAKQAQGFLVGGLSWVQPHAWPFPRENASFPSLSLPHGLSYTTDWAMENTDPRMAKAQAELRPQLAGHRMPCTQHDEQDIGTSLRKGGQIWAADHTG